MVEQPEQSEKLLFRAVTGFNSASRAIGGTTSCPARRRVAAAVDAVIAVDAVDGAAAAAAAAAAVAMA